MIDESQQIYEVPLNSSDFNESGILKPYIAQQFFEQVAERHLDALELSIFKLMEFRLAWVLVSLTVEFQNVDYQCGSLFGRTWYSQKKGPYFRREIIFTDSEEKTVFHGSTFSVLLDLENRTVFRKKELPFSLNEPLKKFTVEAKPTFHDPGEYQLLAQRSVQNSHLDCLGHVNNCRYGEFLYDAFSEEELKRLYLLKRMELYFSSELRKGELFSLKGRYQRNQIWLRGCHQNDKTSFDGIFYYEPFDELTDNIAK